MTLSAGSREAALVHAADIVTRAWRSFDAPRPGQPGTSEETLRLTAERLPEAPTDALTVLDLAETILDESLSQSRPRYLAFICSSDGTNGVWVSSSQRLTKHGLSACGFRKSSV